MLSRFCPECGYDSESEKLTVEHKCPNCGELIKSRFCPECGFDGRLTASIAKKRTVVSIKTYIVLGHIPMALVALFSLLLFALYAAPVAIIPAHEVFGEMIAAESYGNIYTLGSGILGVCAKLEGEVITLIAVATIAVLFSAIVWLLRLINRTKLKRVKIGKASLSLTELLSYIGGVVFTLLCLILASVILGKISAFDGGMEIAEIGACPILLVVFSAVFLLLVIGVSVCRHIGVVRSPEYAETENEHVGSKPNISIKPLIAMTAVVVVAVSISVPLGLHFSSIFRVGKVENIEIGMQREQVADILGTPKEASRGNDRLYWYENSVDKKMRQLDALSSAGGLFYADKIQERIDRLEIDKLTFDFIMVKFDGEGGVSEVFSIRTTYIVQTTTMRRQKKKQSRR